MCKKKTDIVFAPNKKKTSKQNKKYCSVGHSTAMNYCDQLKKVFIKL